jgi:pimeloyl-ACP methyl ester carboxylesterase
LFAGHGISYCVLGSGPPLVIVKPHRGSRVYPWAQRLAARYTVIQIEPLGHGWSDRPLDHPPGGVHEQVHAVLDGEGIDCFPIWGYSAGGTMALTITQASPRVTAMVCGGSSPAERLSEAQLRRMDREKRMPIGQRAFWHWHSRFDWMTELELMRVPRLVYVGTEDGPRARGPRGIPRVRGALEERGVKVVELDGLDHITCMTEPAFSTRVEPVVTRWLAKALR